MTSLWAVEAGARFWEAAGGRPPGFPRDLRHSVAIATPLAVADLPKLDTAAIARWTSAMGLPLSGPSKQRPLRAALYASAHGGFVFLDSEDPTDEQRYSLAHEVAHFLIEFVERRRRAAARVGRSVLDAIDGTRAPTAAERMNAALAGFDLRPHLHLFERAASGLPRTPAASHAEAQADVLAIELLAPVDVVQHVCPAGVPAQQAALRLSETFGLPADVATAHARELAPAKNPRFRHLLPVHEAFE